jgi:hypothetical protein
VHPPAPPSPPAAPPADRRPLVVAAATVVLALGAAAIGLRDRPVPERVPGGWQVAAVPGGLWLLLAVVVAVLLTTAIAVTRWTTGFPATDPRFLGWLLVVLAAAAAQTWNALFMAALADPLGGAVIPVFDWAFTLVPGVLVALLARSGGARAAVGAVLGSGVVTVPLHALGWALYFAAEPTAGALGNVVYSTAILGVVPLLVAVALARSWGRRREQDLR